MKSEPDLIPFEVWVEQFTQEEIDVLVEDADTEVSVKCPSCDGDGEIEFQHSFKGTDGVWQYTSYEVECEYCEGEGSFVNDLSDMDIMKDIYKKQVQHETSKYNVVYLLQGGCI